MADTGLLATGAGSIREYRFAIARLLRDAAISLQSDRPRKFFGVRRGAYRLMGERAAVLFFLVVRPGSANRGSILAHVALYRKTGDMKAKAAMCLIRGKPLRR
ncbi:hypothetical protein QF002_000876 [Paraburkholderia youngii]